MNKRVLGVILFGCVALGSAVSYRWYQQGSFSVFQDGSIRLYAGGKDRALVTKIFKENFYTLTANPDHDFDLMLERRSPNKWETKYFGKMDTYLVYDQDRPAGFISFYMQSSYIGKILFLAIDDEFRGKGYAKKLIQFALDTLKKQGAQVVKIATRTDNKAAQNLYGNFFKFVKENEEDGFIFYRKDV